MFGFLQSFLGGAARSADRRQSARHADDTRVELEVGSGEVSGRMVDVSATGVRVRSSRRVDVGRPLVARVQLQNGCTHLPLVVKWVSLCGDHFEFGAVPDPNHPVSRSLLRSYASRFHRRAPRVRAA